MSSKFRISQLTSCANEISSVITNSSLNAGTWGDRFGFKLIQVSIENIEFSDRSRELVDQFNSNRMNLKAYEGISQRASDMSAQQKIAEGVRDNGMGNMGGMVFGMSYAQGLDNKAAEKKPTLSFDEQIEALKKLKSLLDAGILTQEEFDAKKKEIMGL